MAASRHIVVRENSKITYEHQRIELYWLEYRSEMHKTRVFVVFDIQCITLLRISKCIFCSRVFHKLAKKYLKPHFTKQFLLYWQKLTEICICAVLTLSITVIFNIIYAIRGMNAFYSFHLVNR